MERIEMKHYKDSSGKIFAYELDGSQDAYIAAELIPVNDAELAILRAPTAAQVINAENIKIKKELEEIDKASIRAIREYIAAKTDAPQILKDRELLATTKRGKLK